MTSLLLARAQMGLSLAFHIVFAAVGVALPLLMVACDVLHWRTGDGQYEALSRRLAKGTAILFAVGAVSGTVLSFEMGLLWPGLMGTYGEVIGLPFALEGFAFFTEAIFLGIYLYGRGRISRRFHLFSGITVALSGAASAFFVVLVNACMNLPAGFRLENGKPVDIDPLAAMFSPPWQHETLHVLLSSYQATAFAMAGIHAVLLWRNRRDGLHRKALGLSLAVGGIAAVLQLVSGDFSARQVARQQPIKLAALEGQFETMRGAPLRIGGWPDEEKGVVRYDLELPHGLSLLAFHDLDAEVLGLRSFPRDQWPPVRRVHLAFQVMVGAGSLMALLAVIAGALAWKKRGLPDSNLFLAAVISSAPLGVIALEAGWLVTEWGRQPWVIRGALLTRDAVTPFQALAVPFWTFTLVYLFLGVTVAYLLVSQMKGARGDAT